MSTMGGYLEYRGGYHNAHWGNHEYRGVFNTMEDTILCNLSTMGDIMIHVGDIIGTVEGFSTVGYSNNKRFFPHGTHDVPHMHHDIPHSTEYLRGTQDNPHVTHDIAHSIQGILPWYRTPPRYSRYPPTFIMISSTVLNIPLGTQGIPHMHHDIPHGTAHTLYRVIPFKSPALDQ